MRDELELKNARIRSATITMEDHGVLMVNLDLDYGGTGQGFGGYCLANVSRESKHWSIKTVAGHFIIRVMQVAGVERWDRVAGSPIRVRASHNKVQSIGHILNEDWFDPAEDFKELQ